MRNLYLVILKLYQNEMPGKQSPILTTKDTKSEAKRQTQSHDDTTSKEKNIGVQSLPNCMQLLSQEELDTFSTYKHSTGKTRLELWMIQGPTGFAERLWPSFISANSLTLIAQIPILAILLYVFSTQGTHISPDNPIDSKVLLTCGFLVQWFSQTDIMDGLRARRMNIGSPLGRIIDEAGDCIVMANYSVLVGYIVAFDNKWWELIFFYLNICFYGMEIRYKICKALVMLVGEISSVEIEIMISLIFIFGGIYGGDGLQKSFGEHFEIESDSTSVFAVLAPYRLSSILGCFFSFL